MRIVHLNEGPKAAFSLQGTVLTVDGVSIDLATRQRDVQTVIDISRGRDLQTAAEGVGAWYIATVVIPPRQYRLVETEDGGVSLEPLPIDLSQVELRLWALPQTLSATVTGEEA